MNLTAREAMVVRLLEQEGQSLAVVARRVSEETFPLLGRTKVSRERVRQIYERVQRKRAAAAERLASTWPWEGYAL